jgi:hypothetical protein
MLKRIAFSQNKADCARIMPSISRILKWSIMPKNMPAFVWKGKFGLGQTQTVNTTKELLTVALKKDHQITKNEFN